MGIDLNGQVAIVTGAGRGMGRDIALLLGQRGASVVVNDYGGDIAGHAGDGDYAARVAREIEAAGGKAISNRSAVGTSDAADEIVESAFDAFGRVDILVNNAGVTANGPIDQTAQEAIDLVIAVNYLGPYALMRRVWPSMRAQGYGRILNVASGSVLGMGNMAPYGSSKAALAGLTSDAGLEGMRLGIAVNGLWPSGHTRMSNEATSAEYDSWATRYLDPAKVAPAAVYLVSKDIHFGGETFSVGAGRVARVAHISGNGYFDPDLTPESVAEHIDQIRDLTGGQIVTSVMDELGMIMRHCPWTAGTLDMTTILK